LQLPSIFSNTNLIKVKNILVHVILAWVKAEDDHNGA